MSISILRIWSNLYLHNIPNASAGGFEHSSSLLSSSLKRSTSAHIIGIPSTIAQSNNLCTTLKKNVNDDSTVACVVDSDELTWWSNESKEQNYCETFDENIKADEPQKTHETQHWHATDACFYCHKCRIPLNNRGFFPRYGEIFCTIECLSHKHDY